MEKDWPRYHQMGSFWQVNSDHSTSPAAYPTMGVVASRKAARAGARRLKSPAYPQQELALLSERQEALGEQQEPPLL